MQKNILIRTEHKLCSCMQRVACFVNCRLSKVVPSGLLVSDVPRDGNCLFSAIAVQLCGDAAYGMYVRLIFCLRAAMLVHEFVAKVRKSLQF